MHSLCVFVCVLCLGQFVNFVISKMEDVKEQCVCIKFCVKLEKNAAETHKMLKQAFGDNALGVTETYNWFKHLKNG